MLEAIIYLVVCGASLGVGLVLGWNRAALRANAVLGNLMLDLSAEAKAEVLASLKRMHAKGGG